MDGVVATKACVVARQTAMSASVDFIVIGSVVCGDEEALFGCLFGEVVRRDGNLEFGSVTND